MKRKKKLIKTYFVYTKKKEAIIINNIKFAQWIPAHCGTKGNEEADKVAINGAAATQPEVNLTYHEKKTLMKTTFTGKTQRDDYHLLNREDQVILFRLRTGHNRLNHKIIY